MKWYFFSHAICDVGSVVAVLLPSVVIYPLWRCWNLDEAGVAEEATETIDTRGSESTRVIKSSWSIQSRLVFVLENFQVLLEISRTQFYTSRIYRKKGCSREVLHLLFSRIREFSRILELIYLKFCISNFALSDLTS